VIEPDRTRAQRETGPLGLRALARDPLAILVTLVGAFLICASTYWAVGTGDSSSLDRYTALVGVPGGVVVILAAFRLRGAGRLDPSVRKMWSLVVTALALYSMGAAVHVVAISEPGLGFLGGASMLLEIAAYPIAWAALLALPGPGRTATDILLLVLDVAIVAFSASMLGWHLWLYPIAREAGASFLETLWVALPPALDLATIFAIGATLPRARQLGTAIALWILVVSIAAALVGDWLAGVEILRGVYRMGGVPGLFYSFAWLGFALAAYAQLRVPQRERPFRGQTHYSRDLPWLPYAALAAAYFIPTFGSWNDKELLQQHLPATGLLMGLVVARLAVTARENDRLGAAERETLAMAVDQATDAILTTNRRGVVTYVNPAFARITGYPAEEVVGRAMSDLEGDTGGWSGAEVRAVTSRGESWSGRMEGRRKDGEPFHVHMTVAPLRDPGGAIAGSIGVAKDITREQELEVELARAQRMEAIGRLAGGVAHDFNNILTVINGFSELALTELPPDHPVTEDISEISRASERAASLTRALLAFSRRQVMRPQPVNLNEVVAGLAPMLGVLMGDGTEIEVKPADRLGWAMADRAQLEQVILNLASNARDAMPAGGRLTIATKNVTLSEKYARTHLGSHAGPHVALVVADTGMGMTPEVRDHAFEPFFTTKERGKGTGLGLSTAIGVVEQSGGSIQVESKPGAGSEFTVYLPRAPRPDKAPESETPAPDRPVARGTETILVVEDEDPVRAFVERTLRQSGYRVLTARNGAEALDLAKSEPHLHLLFTDMVMPGMSGRELATRLATARPGLPAVFASGYSDEALGEGFGEEGAVPYLAKPFSAETLLNRVREALDGRTRGRT
jgi:PAS domain S-box-containing protein